MAPARAAFSILTSDRLTATQIRAHAHASHTDRFQYPDLGSFDCNSSYRGLLAWHRRQTFSILTSDRLTATSMTCRAAADASDRFQYPDLGSFDCNLRACIVRGLRTGRFQYPDLGSFDCNVPRLRHDIAIGLSVS